MVTERFLHIFGKQKALIGMVHLDALPGTPLSTLSVKEITEKAIFEAQLLAQASFDAIIIENMHDVPYMNRTATPEVIAAAATIALEVNDAVAIPLGIQLLAGANKAALAVALASGCDFIRAEGFVFGHVADEGYIESDAGELLRYRKQIGAEQVSVFTDIKKKHSSHVITGDVSLVETAKAASFFLSDGLIVTGSSTGEEASVKELEAVYAKSDLPIFVGSGISADNLGNYMNCADAFIVGSSIKVDGNWQNPVDYDRAEALVKMFKKVTNT